MSKFYIRQAKDGQYYFSLKSEQGSTLLSSEMYTTLKACENGLASVKKNAAQTAQYEYKEAANGKFHFNLKAANHQVIGSSTMYETEQAAQEAAAVVAAEVADAEVVSEIEGASKEEAPAEAPAEEAAPAAAPAAEPKSAARKSSLNASVKPEDFDWDAFEGSDVYGAADRKAIDEAYENTLSKVVENEVVEGEVTAITKREVVVTIGGKVYGRVTPEKVRDILQEYFMQAE